MFWRLLHGLAVVFCYRVSRARDALHAFFAERLPCRLGLHDWEEVAATGEQLNSYRLFYFRQDWEDQYGDGWAGREDPPLNRICLREDCQKVDPRLERALKEGLIRWDIRHREEFALRHERLLIERERGLNELREASIAWGRRQRAERLYAIKKPDSLRLIQGNKK